MAPLKHWGHQLQGKSLFKMGGWHTKRKKTIPSTSTYQYCVWKSLRYHEISIMSDKNGNPIFWIRMWYLRIHAYCLSNEKTTLHDKMGTFGHADNLGDHLPTLAMYFVSSLDLQNSVYLESPTMEMFCGLFKGQQNLSGNIVRISHYITLHYISCTHACIAHTYWNVHMIVTQLYVLQYVYVNACECGEKMSNDYQMTIVCVQEQIKSRT